MIRHHSLSLLARCLWLTAALLIAHHSSLVTTRAQSATATLSGTVVDQSGAVVPGVEITVENISTALKRQTTTNEQGYFTVPLLPPSTYTVTAQRTGFTPLRIPDVVLNVGDQRTVQIQLRAGNLNETVQVTGEAPLVNDSPAVGTIIDRQFVANLPLNGRSFQSLFELTPGTVLTKASANEQGQFSVNGQRADANYFTIDGVSANIGVSSGASPGQSAVGALPGLNAFGGTNNLVSVDALQEFRLQTSTYAPEFGRTPGGQVSLITRSGTNQFRGTLFEYFRNDKLDAMNWFNNANRLPKPAQRQNDFGGVLGGPLLKHRTFFFFSYEGLRLRQPLSALLTVPSLNARQLAPAALQPFLHAFPLPNGANLTLERAQFAASYSNPSTLDAASLRIDHTLNSQLTLFGRYSHTPSETVQRQSVLVTRSRTAVKTQTLTAGAALIITPKLSHDFRANYSSNRGSNTLTADNFGGAVPVADAAIFPSFATRDNAFYLFSITGVGSFTVGKNAVNRQRQINLVDTLSWVNGSHELKFGVDYRRLLPVAESATYLQAVFFSGVTGAGGATAGTVLSGRAQSVQVQAIAAPRRLALTNFSAFAQDTWKLARRLTLTYGLRWEVNTPPRERSGNQYALVGIDNPATLSVSARGAALWRTTYDNFAPRLGLAYRLAQKAGRETVLRGGFGIFYDLGSSDAALGFVSNVFPYSTTKLLTNEPYPLAAASAQPPVVSTTLPTASAFIGSDPNLELPRVYQWNLAAEQSLGPHQLVSAAYVGAVGRRLLRRDLLLRPNANFTSTVQVRRNTATSDYHALQLQFQRRLSRGLQALASYTWAHSIDTSSNDSGVFAPAGKVNLAQERGSSDFDVRHAFTAAVTYHLPQAPVGKVPAQVLNDWAVDLIYRARSATPVDILVGTDVLGTGSPFLSRPDLLSGVPLWLDDPLVPRGKRINRAAFSTSFSGRQGTLGRNVLRGFPVQQLDLALRRQFKLTERVRLQFRAEFFNLFNHPNFGDPQGTLLSGANPNPLFGQSTQMLSASLGTGGANGGLNPLYQIGGPRSIQLALKLTF